jgi:hypothetical protein
LSKLRPFGPYQRNGNTFDRKAVADIEKLPFASGFLKIVSMSVYVIDTAEV